MFVEKGEIWVERICGNGWLWFEYVSQSVCARISMQGSNTGRWGPSDVSIVKVPPLPTNRSIVAISEGPVFSPRV